MLCLNCKQQLPEQFTFCPNCQEPSPNSSHVQVHQDIGVAGGEIVGVILGEGIQPAVVSVNSTQNVEKVEASGSVVGVIIGGPQRYNNVVHNIDTGGGLYIEGGVSINNGNFVGRDEVLNPIVVREGIILNCESQALMESEDVKKEPDSGSKIT